MEQENYTIALLIDAENISAKYMSVLNKELIMFGRIIYKRIYANFTDNSMNKWKSVINEFALTPVQQFSYTKGKNATDSRLIIDAMDILYENMVNAVCIVASDSDYTTIAKRIKESNVFVFGAGEEKTPNSFINACDRFLDLNLLMEKYGEKETSKEGVSEEEQAEINKEQEKLHKEEVEENTVLPTPKEEVEMYVIKLLEEAENYKKPLEFVMNKIHQAYSNFSFLQYKVKKAVEFFSAEKFQITKAENAPNMYIELVVDEPTESEIIKTTIKILRAGKKPLNLGTLCDKIYKDEQIAKKYPNFRFETGEIKTILSNSQAQEKIELSGEKAKTTVSLKRN